MKDYKKILEGVVDIINVTEKSDIGFANICTYIGENCPEFKESEDERIRKEILDCFKAMKQQGCFPSKHKEQYDSWIAWLEKQGEHSNFRNKIQIGDKVTRNKDGVLVNLSQLNRVAKKQGEQKHAWSEEDEKEVAILEAYIHSKDWSYKHIDRALGIVDELANKVKSLKDKYTWKPSDEQIEALESATENCAYSEYQDCLRELIGQLKKLREE